MAGFYKKAEFHIWIILSSLIIIGYTIFIVPGINVTVPAHGDIYGYSTHFDSDLLPFSRLYLAPRPIMLLALKLLGSLPYNFMMWMLFIISVLSFFAPLVVYSKIVKKDIPVMGLVLFALLVNSYPGVFLGMIHDFGARLALIFAMISIYFYVKFLRLSEYYYLFLAFIYGLLGFLSKETFGPCVFFLMLYIGYLCKAKIRYIVTGNFVVMLGLVLSLLHSRLVGSPFTSGQSSYIIDFKVLSILIRGLHYLKYAITPQIFIGLLIICILLLWKRDWKYPVHFVVGFLISLSSLLPNAMLSQHGGSPYEIILVPLLSGLIVIHMDFFRLFSNNKRTILCLMTAIAISGVIWGEYQLKTHFSWEMGVARFNQNVLHSLDIYKEEIRASDNVVVFGLQQDHIVQPWTPFTHSKFLKDNFDFLTTTFSIISPGITSLMIRNNDSVRLSVAKLEDVNKAGVDLIMVFGADGNVWRIIRQRERINKLFALNNLDMTKLYDRQYWATNIDPILSQS